MYVRHFSLDREEDIMERIPFKRVTEAFDEIARARICRSSSSSGSEHDNSSAEELSDLINSFMEENDSPPEEEEEEDDEASVCPESDISTSSSPSGDYHVIQKLLSSTWSSDGVNVKEMIRSETELILKQIMRLGFVQQEFKRHLMSSLRDRGLDAGLCKSRWKNIGQFPAGDYEYVDVIVDKTRYIVEINLAGEFVIARPTNNYQSLLQLFPAVFVGEPDDLRQLVKLMGSAVRNSMKKCDLNVPPWRRNGYMLAKWFGSYKRTTNSIVKMKMANTPNRREICADVRAVGFEIVPVISRFSACGEVGRKASLRLGNLARAFGGSVCN